VQEARLAVAADEHAEVLLGGANGQAPQQLNQPLPRLQVPALKGPLDGILQPSN
jgi:hypothetical protein